jgi:hypothetical protein
MSRACSPHHKKYCAKVGLFTGTIPKAHLAVVITKTFRNPTRSADRKSRLAMRRQRIAKDLRKKSLSLQASTAEGHASMSPRQFPQQTAQSPAVFLVELTSILLTFL